MTKIDIISGFLGAGKTTLIRKLLSEALTGEQVVLIENEFGEIGIDGGFLKDAGIEIREMNSGCICCSLVGDFGTALREVIDTYHPDRIIIEPSGVGKLTDVVKAVQNVEGAKVNCKIAVVDVCKCKMYLKNFGEFYKNQIGAADCIILSRMDTDKATPLKVMQAMANIRELNEQATVITTPISSLSGQKLLETLEGVKVDLTISEHHHHDEECGCGHDHEHHHHDHEEHHLLPDGTCSCGHDHSHDHEHHHHDGECGCGHDHSHDHEHHHHDGECGCGHDHDHHHHHHHADEVFQSWGIETVKKFDREEIRKIMDALGDEEKYGMVLRAKGMLPDENGVWTYFDMVPEEAELRDGQPEYTGRICVIGAGLKENNLKELFGV